MSDLRSKIYTSKILLLKQTEINNKNNTFASLGDDFNLSEKSLIGLHKDNLIKISNCFLLKKYTDEYKKCRQNFETSQYRKFIASGSGPDPKTRKGWDSYLTDKYCGLKKETYEKLMLDGKVKVDILDLEYAINNTPSPLDFISFNLEIYAQKLEGFLTEKIDLFIKDELDLTEKISGAFSEYFNDSELPANTDKATRVLSYQKQKEDFSVAIVNQTNKGYPFNNLKIDYAQVWQRNVISQTNFLETALGMEREGLVEIRDIFEQMPKRPLVVSSDIYWRHPTIIQMKVLPTFNQYYEGVYKKYNPAKITEIREKGNTATDKTKDQGGLNPEISVGKLVAYNDGTIRYGKDVLKMRNQLKDLCRLFMERPNMLITIDDIKDNIIHANKRGLISHSTIAKYISELRKLLKVHFQKDTLLSQNGEGWTFSP